MSPKYQIQPSKVDEYLTVLANQTHRSVLYYFRGSSAEVASLDDLVSYVLEQNGGDTEQVTIQMYHSTLPRLADTGVLDFLRTERTVKYLGNPELERLLDSVIAYESGISQTSL